MQQTPPPKSLSPKSSEQNAGGASTPSGKTKKRERSESSMEASKRERPTEEAGGESTAIAKSDSHHANAEEVEKEGVSSVASVERLVSAMQQDRSDGGRKQGECAGRRTLLAAAIAGSESHECLERFVQLGGVALFHEWLQDAYKGKCEGESPKDGVSKAVEELLLMILSALEKLPVDLQALRCQVGKSVNNLKSHKNVEIKEKARKLVETWKKRVGDEMNLPAGSKSGSQWSTNIKNLPISSDMQPAAGAQQASNGLYKSSEKGSTNASGALAWKDEAKNSTLLPSSGSKPTHRTSNLHAKGSSGLNPAGSKEAQGNKPAGWIRDKGELPAPDSGTKLVLRLPRTASAAVNEEVFGPGSQGSSPSLPDQTTASSIADASDAKQRLQRGSSEPLAEQQEENGKPEPKELPSGAEVSRASEANERAVSMAIVPASAISRVSGNEGDAGLGLSARSMVMSTADREAGEGGVTENGAAKEEARRKEAQDAGDVANCASSSSFTEMSVAGQVAAVQEHKSELSSAVQDGDEDSRLRLELEGLGESPEPRPSSRKSDQSGEPEKRVVGDVSSTQGGHKPAFGARCGYEGLGRRLERYDNSWEEKRSSYFPGKEGRKVNPEAGKAEPESSRLKSPDFKASQEMKRMESASEFMVDDALEVAQQIAKEVEQEVETSHLSSTKDEREHLAAKEPPVSSPGQVLEKVPAEVQESPALEAMEKATNEPEASSERSQQVSEPADKEDDEELPGESSRVEEEKVSPCQPAASSSNAEDEKPAEVTQSSRPVFDLNEGLGGDEGGMRDLPCESPPAAAPAVAVAGPTTPIPLLPKGGAFIPPEALMKAKSEPGWRGSAATSAFRPAEPRRVQDQQQHQSAALEIKEVSFSGKQPRPPLDIDLNVADTEDGFESSNPFTRSFSDKPHQQARSTTTERVDFDLNCADGCEDDVQVEKKPGSTTRDFDLNGPVEEEPEIQHIDLRNSSSDNNNTMAPPSVTGFRLGNGAGELAGVAAAPWFPSGNSFPAVAIPSFPMARAESSYPVQAQSFLNAHFNVDLYRGGMTLATPAVAYPTNPPVPYPYAAAGFPFASNYSFSASGGFPASFVEAPAGSGSYTAGVSSQIAGPGSMSRFIRPHLMGIGDAPARNDGAWASVRPSLDLNTGPEVVAEEMRPQRSVALEDHLRGFGQVAAAAAPPNGKRKEPESGWEAFQAGYKQPAWC